MAVSLEKGGNVSLTKTSPNTSKFKIGLGWNANTTSSGKPFDVDVSAFVLGENGKVLADEAFIFYNNKNYKDFITHTGDNQDGLAEGDDESLLFDSNKQIPDWKSIKFIVTIHDALAKAQNFGQISGSYIRIVDEITNTELVRFDLNEDFSTETAMEFGELYLNGSEIKFRAIGTGQKTGLANYCTQYGVNI